MTEWIKSSDKMPDPMEGVLALGGDGVEMEVWYSRDGKRWEWHEYFGRDFKYWMPLPPPPMEKP